VPVLSMEDYRQELIEIWLRAELPGHARRLVAQYLERRLPDVPIAYPADWGLAGTGPHEGLCLDGYAEIGLSTVYGVAQSIRPGAIGLEETAQTYNSPDSTQPSPPAPC
jgi:methionyl-tRNA synthetase